MKIAYYVHDLSFPLREGVRKQAWWMAKTMKEEGHEVIIVSTAKKKKTLVKDGIKIYYGSPLYISRVKTDVLHVLSHPSPLIVPLLFRVQAKKVIMTMFDGYLNEFWKRPWSAILSRIVNSKVHLITLQTLNQVRLLERTEVEKPMKIIPPIFPILKKKGERSGSPQLLFMSHMHPEKGIFDVLAAFKLSKKIIPGLRLVIADSGITTNSKLSAYLRNDPDIILKKTINPTEELSKSWIYLYPVRSPKETFSIPLSLVESLQVGTPFISTEIGALPSLFDKDFLVPPRDPRALAERIKNIIFQRKKPKNNLQIKNQDTINSWRKLYGAA